MKTLLLAAGKSSRMWPLAEHKNKCMYELLGKPILYYTLMDLKKLGLLDVVIIISDSDRLIKEYFGNGKRFGLKISYAIQKEQSGMADAILSAKRYVDGKFIVANASKINLGELLEPMLKMDKVKKSHIILASRLTDQPWNYGVLKVKGTQVIGIVEKPAKGAEPSNKKVEGAYIFTEKFLKMLEKGTPAEYLLEETLQQYIQKYGNASYIDVSKTSEFTLKYPWHMFDINKLLLDSIIGQRISPTAKIHKTAIIEGNVIIEGKAVVHEYATIKGPCYIGESTIIAKNAIVREYSNIGKNCVIGFSTDVKGSIMFGDVRADMCYIGDSILDEGARFGAGTVTANRRLDRKNIISPVKGEKIDTGRSFFGSIVGKDAKTGIHASLMPGTKIGLGSLVWPNTVVLKDVPDNSEVFIEAKTTTRKIDGK